MIRLAGFLLLVLLAVALGLYTQAHHGYVIFYFSPWKLTFSLTSFLFLALLGGGTVWLVWHLLVRILSLPARARAWRKRRRAARRHMLHRNAQLHFYAGRYPRAERTMRDLLEDAPPDPTPGNTDCHTARSAPALITASDPAPGRIGRLLHRFWPHSGWDVHNEAEISKEQHFLYLLQAGHWAHLYRDHVRRDAYLNAARAYADEAGEHGLALDMLSAQCLCEEERYPEALDRLTAVYREAPRLITALRLELRIRQQLRQYTRVMELATQLESRSAIDASSAVAIRAQAAIAQLRETISNPAETDKSALHNWWNALGRDERRDPALAALAAQGFAQQGDLGKADTLLAKSLNRHWDSASVQAYGQLADWADRPNPAPRTRYYRPAAHRQRAPADRDTPVWDAVDASGTAYHSFPEVSHDSDTAADRALLEEKRRLLKRAEAWLSAHPRDAELLLALGRLCRNLKLWGKAQSYFEGSLSLHEQPATHYELNQLLTHTQGDPALAAWHLQEALAGLSFAGGCGRVSHR